MNTLNQQAIEREEENKRPVHCSNYYLRGRIMKILEIEKVRAKLRLNYNEEF